MSVNISDKTHTIAECSAKGASLTPGDCLTLSGLSASGRAYYGARLFKKAGRPVLVVTRDEDEAEAFAQDLVFFLGEGHVQRLPSTELLPFELQTTHEEISALRVEALYNLAEHKPIVTVTSARNLMQRVMSKTRLVNNVIKIAAGAERPMDALVVGLIVIG